MMRKRDRIRSIWTDMHRRCVLPHRPDFKWYGARGVYVCEDWNDLSVFRKWAIENGYQEDLTLDRKDNMLPYTPSNCVWSTIKAQDRNRTSNVFLEHNGERRCLAEWAEIAGISQATLWMRLNRRHWTLEKALLVPTTKAAA